MPKTIKAIFEFKYDCKNSRRYAAVEEGDFPIQDVYVKRPWSNEVDTFELTIVLHNTKER